MLVFAPGCWDMLHWGHVQLLERAARQGSKLIVGLNSDASVARLKGPTRPVIKYDQRYGMLKALRCVDDVIPIVEDTPCSLIKMLRPAILIKGPGYLAEEMPEYEIMKAFGGRIIVMDGPDISTTKLVQRLQGAA
jgi:D-beta-D-heptose 7-phosphate kinase/D-beta-D-heptose 1-phosphate adenosyltransferase